MKKCVIIFVLCVISCGIGVGIGHGAFHASEKGGNNKKRLITDQNRGEWGEIKHDSVKSKLADKGKCWLCGNDNHSLMGYFRKFDDIGIICTNSWYVLDFKVVNHDEEGNRINADGGRLGWVANGKEECSFETDQMQDRGISDVKVEYGSKSYFDASKIKNHLCQGCLDKVLNVMETYGYKDEAAKPRDICLVDFQTLELYPVQEHNLSYFIRDYLVQIDNHKEKTEVQVIYAPVLDQGNRE